MIKADLNSQDLCFSFAGERSSRIQRKIKYSTA